MFGGSNAAKALFLLFNAIGTLSSAGFILPYKAKTLSTFSKRELPNGISGLPIPRCALTEFLASSEWDAMKLFGCTDTSCVSSYIQTIGDRGKSLVYECTGGTTSMSTSSARILEFARRGLNLNNRVYTPYYQNGPRFQFKGQRNFYEDFQSKSLFDATMHDSDHYSEYRVFMSILALSAYHSCDDVKGAFRVYYDDHRARITTSAQWA
ncbi:hypothetical protein AX774_g6222 [Zancudomyces culisetae]|uniref:Uncharacterized protein n=1 Tax=Zancudomyces culisetae TaxID=1213189 RepID=A0A1R1PH93_ZANCU|nr:hypothetical protein AX774_g6222 [Zancudomyces culisetae]|eukprot:OMH80344.1 hypothetical protein AX774_g6222 [Zancudomyces culisetae]